MIIFYQRKGNVSSIKMHYINIFLEYIGLTLPNEYQCKWEHKAIETLFIISLIYSSLSKIEENWSPKRMVMTSPVKTYNVTMIVFK